MSDDKEAGRAGSLFADFLSEQGELEAATAEAERRMRDLLQQPARTASASAHSSKAAVYGQVVAAKPAAHGNPRTSKALTSGPTARYRSASTGRFVTARHAKSHPKTTVKE
ncbi:MAG: hypothetical protein H6843_15010 [Rhodospirillaceae bacterium]|nr:hypothetical protein [Rhodospirillaceae bacterium]